MPYATGTRLAAAFFCLTGVGIPIGMLLLWQARKKEKERKRELEALNVG